MYNMDILMLFNMQYNASKIVSTFISKYENPANEPKARESFLKLIFAGIDFDYQVKQIDVLNVNVPVKAMRKYKFKMQEGNPVVDQCDDFISHFCAQANGEKFQTVLRMAMFSLEVFHTFLWEQNRYSSNFEEPIVRLALPFLKVLNVIRAQKILTKSLLPVQEREKALLYGFEIETLEIICKKYYVIVKRGIQIPNLQSYLIENLCSMLKKDLFVLLITCKETVQLCMDSLSCVADKRSIACIYDCWISILKGKDYNQEVKKEFIHELVRDDIFLQIFIQASNSKANNVVLKLLVLANAIFKLLNQPNFGSAVLVDEIARNLFNRSKQVQKMAVGTFLQILKIKQLTSGNILKAILDFYIEYNETPNELHHLVELFWEPFKYIQNFQNIFSLYSTSNRTLVNMVIGYFTLDVCKKMMQSRVKYTEELRDLIKLIPETLRTLHHEPEPLMILMNVFAIVDIKIFDTICHENDQNIEQTVSFLANVFLNEHLSYIRGRFVFSTIRKFCSALRLNEEILHNVAEKVYDDFADVLIQLEQSSPYEFQDENAPIIRSMFMRLSVWLEYEPFLGNNNESFQIVLKDSLVRNNKFKETKEVNDEIEPLAIRIYCGCIKSMYKTVIEKETVDLNKIDELLDASKEFMTFLVQNIDIKNRKESVFFGEMVIASIIEIIVLFCHNEERDGPVASLLVFQMPENHFTVVLDAIIYYVFEYKISETTDIIESRKSILNHFKFLLPPIMNLPMSILSKILFFYGSTEKFNEEFENILTTLKKADLKILLNAISIMLLMLTNRQISDENFPKHVKKFTNFISSTFHGDRREMTKAHILLQYTEGLVNVCRSPNDGNNNRLMLLHFLDDFINEYSLCHIDPILNQMNEHFLSPEEKSQLSNFKNKVSLFSASVGNN